MLVRWRTQRRKVLEAEKTFEEASISKIIDIKSDHIAFATGPKALMCHLLKQEGWSHGRPGYSYGNLLLPYQYTIPSKLEALRNQSRISQLMEPDGILHDISVNPSEFIPWAAIKTHPDPQEAIQTLFSAQRSVLWLESGIPSTHKPINILAIAIAGTNNDNFKILISRQINKTWRTVTYDGQEITKFPKAVEIANLIKDDEALDIKAIVSVANNKCFIDASCCPIITLLVGFKDKLISFVKSLKKEGKISADKS